MFRALPELFTPLLDSLRTHFSQEFNQIIVNEYQPGQGIGPHIDCIPCFAETIAVVSLGSGAEMEFSRSSEKLLFYLEPGSLLKLSGPVRYEWRHRIRPRKSDRFQSQKIVRGRRVSLTFRKALV